MDRKSAFTLVEMLVAMVLLMALVTLVLQLVDGTTTATTHAHKRMDADGQARLIFDRMASDFARACLRADLDVLFLKAQGNDCMFFFSEAPGYFGSDISEKKQSPVSLVGYRINSEPGGNRASPRLERLGKGLAWEGRPAANVPGSPVFIGGDLNALSSNWPNAASASGFDRDFHQIGEQAFRMEIAFLLSDGTVSNRPVRNAPKDEQRPPDANDGEPAYLIGSRWYDGTNCRAYICTKADSGAAEWRLLGTKDVSGIIVAIAILDLGSQRLLNDPTKLAGVARAFADPSEEDLQADPPRLMAQRWQAALALRDPVGDLATIPASAAAQIRTYQRLFMLNPR